MNFRSCSSQLASLRRVEENESLAEVNSLLRVGPQPERERAFIEKQPPAGVFNKGARFSLLQFGSLTLAGSIPSLLVENGKVHFGHQNDLPVFSI